MFFKQMIRRNAARNRKDNGLLFGTLVIAIIAFYTLLSLESQDVMRFLKTMESDAVQRLMMLVPFIYVISLFFVFFLVFFAYRYQLENRRKELGLYLILGMKKSRLFMMLMSETFFNSVMSVIIGLPIALLLTEGISLTTAKLVGLGIIGHKISFSLTAVAGTVAGFILVQMIAMLFLCTEFTNKEPVELLGAQAAEAQTVISRKKGWRSFILGWICLALAYLTGIFLMDGFGIFAMLVILVLGGYGTFQVYKGMGVFIGRRIQKRSPSQSGLYAFTGRQIQENVLHQYKALAIASLLLLMAMACISFGVGTAAGRGANELRSVDFSVMGTGPEVSAVLEKEANKSMIDSYYPMYISHIDDEEHTYSTQGIADAIAAQPAEDLRDNMVENISGGWTISPESSYNQLLLSMGKEPIKLAQNQMAAYTSMKDSANFIRILNSALKSGASVVVDNETYELLPQVYHDNVVADRQITLYIAYIVPDEVYHRLARDVDEPFCWNVVLKPELVEEMGLMQAIGALNDSLYGSGLQYESYLSGIGRNLFYTVAASYLTIYLGVLFIIIANTVIGLKYLMQQRAGKQRYRTLLMLGAGKRQLNGSSKKQIRLFFSLVLSVAVCSSVFAIWSMFTSFMKLPAGTSVPRVIALAGVAFLLLVVIEFIYIKIIEHASRREILALHVSDRR